MGYSFAEILVYAARQARDGYRLVAQMMAGGLQLPRLISQILGGLKNSAAVARKFQLPLPAFCILLLASFNNLQIISAQSVSGDIIFTSNEFFVPIQLAVPEYPAQALQDELNGFNNMRFTILKDGTVDPNSIARWYTYPLDVFDPASKRAISQFKFEPPYSNGVNIELPFVQIGIWYDGAEGNVVARLLAPRLLNREYQPLNLITPQYPPRAMEEKIEGYVLVEFTVTTEGDAAGIVILDRQPSDIFNASAIEAMERFRFRPRVMDGIPMEAPGAQYTFNYELNDEC